ncbi:hypothetical protein ACFLS1_05670 [Verrucomicrobiota bacterium]
MMVVTVLPFLCLATPQQHDILKIQNKSYAMAVGWGTNAYEYMPLEAFYTNRVDRPNFCIAPNVMSTGNWRGYVAFWEIDGVDLYLTQINTYIDGNVVTAKDLFPEEYKTRGVKADWFSGVIRLHRGVVAKQIDAVSILDKNESEVFILINKGQVRSVIIGVTMKFDVLFPTAPNKKESIRNENKEKTENKPNK